MFGPPCSHARSVGQVRYPLPVARNYTITTIKTLFAEASVCAYPGCEEPLIFHDRGKTTVVAEIAHIRSEKSNGPRYDPRYTDDIDGPSNLLLLCGKHHRPVDRHEAAYEIAELEQWKLAQRASAGRGTPLTESDARAFARLNADELKILMEIARLAQRVVRACQAAQDAMDAVLAENEQVRLRAAYQFGPIYEEHDDGAKVMINDRMELPWIEQKEWNAKAVAARDSELPRVRQALNELGEEVSVLRMISGPLADDAELVREAAESVSKAVGDSAALDAAVGRLEVSKAQLWQVANGLEDPSS